MSADKYPSIFSRQMAAIVYIVPQASQTENSTQSAYVVYGTACTDVENCMNCIPTSHLRHSDSV